MNELWAKSTGETLLEHTDNVVKIINRLCRSLPLPVIEREQFSSTLSCIGVMHDIGKAASGFQHSLRTQTRWGHRHEILSAAVASIILPELPKEALLAIITHHRSIPESITTVSEKCLPLNELPFDDENPVWDLMTREWIEEWGSTKDILRYLIKPYIFRTINLPLKLRIDGIGLPEKILHRNFQKKVSEFDRHYASLLRGLLMTADHIASAHQFDLPEVPIHKNYILKIKDLELKGEMMRPFQKRCEEITGDAIDAILKAPTGSGKTAAILLWAANNQSKNGRLFYVLPHTASINAMYERLKKIYGKKNVGILHHKSAEYLFNIFESDNSTYDAAQMAKSQSELARELYHPIRVSTPHQILRVALQGKGWELGLAEFPNACFVFDEIHAFEPLFVGLTIATVKWLKRMGAKVLFASATLPLFLEEILKKEIKITNIIMPDSQIPGDKDVLDKIRHKIEVKKGSLCTNIDDIIEEIKNSGETTLIICNHVETSRKIYEKFKKHFFNVNEIKLFHSRFNSADRFKIETIIQSKNPPKILIATQAIEVSLDLDYDCGYIEPAPADALGQRLGRINRKGSRNMPAKVVIFEEPSLKKSEGDPLYLPYDEEITKKTIDCLRKIDKLSEQQLTDIVNEIYKDGYTGNSKKDYERGLNNSAINGFYENMIAGTYKDWVQDVIDGTDGSIEILPIKLYDKFRHLKEEKRYSEAKMLLVPIQTRQSAGLFREKVLYWDKELYEYVACLNYSADTGLDISKQIENIY